MPRERVLSIGRSAAAAASPTLGSHQPFPAPTPVTAPTAIVLTLDQQRLPCVRLLTAADFAAIGRNDVLVEVLHPRRGFSRCTWRTRSHESGVSLSVATARRWRASLDLAPRVQKGRVHTRSGNRA